MQKKQGAEGNTILVRLLGLVAVISACVLYKVMTDDSHASSGSRTKSTTYEASDSAGSRKAQKNHFTYKKYKLEPEKSKRLSKMLEKMLKSHPRQSDEYYGFNVTRSEQISVTRILVDSRPASCRKRKFNYTSFPTVSVICPFYEEALTPLIRHVHALLQMTPPNVLKEIILVDDKSSFSYLGEDLDDYFAVLDPKIKILRNEERQGLILSRMTGAEVAQGDVLMFMDAHMEVNHGWLEPILDRLVQERALAVQSEITPILTDTLDVNTGLELDHIGAFGWDLSYLWFQLPPYLKQFRMTAWDPVPFPVLQGGSIAIWKSYFKELGGFDTGMEVWGGEHYEMSFNIWLTGGRIEIATCSKVGHIFKESRYGLGAEEKMSLVFKNNYRVAEIWMDEYKELVKAALRARQSPEPVFTMEEWASIEERRKLRSKRQSKHFSWFLKHVVPYQPIPTDEDIYFGQVASGHLKQCLTVLDTGFLSLTPSCKQFVVIIKDDTFSLDRWGRFRRGAKCVGADDKTSLLKLVECPCIQDGRASSFWGINPANQLVMTDPSGSLCATLVATSPSSLEYRVQLQACTDNVGEQVWSFMYQFKYN